MIADGLAGLNLDDDVISLNVDGEYMTDDMKNKDGSNTIKSKKGKVSIEEMVKGNLQRALEKGKLARERDLERKRDEARQLTIMRLQEKEKKRERFHKAKASGGHIISHYGNGRYDESSSSDENENENKNKKDQDKKKDDDEDDEEDDDYLIKRKNKRISPLAQHPGQRISDFFTQQAKQRIEEEEKEQKRKDKIIQKKKEEFQ
ncbi:MAG: hypothetical protein EZS28_054984, partial [Streblomastix strix]